MIVFIKKNYSPDWSEESSMKNQSMMMNDWFIFVFFFNDYRSLGQMYSGFFFLSIVDISSLILEMKWNDFRWIGLIRMILWTFEIFVFQKIFSILFVLKIIKIFFDEFDHDNDRHIWLFSLPDSWWLKIEIVSEKKTTNRFIVRITYNYGSLGMSTIIKLIMVI